MGLAGEVVKMRKLILFRRDIELIGSSVPSSGSEILKYFARSKVSEKGPQQYITLYRLIALLP